MCVSAYKIEWESVTFEMPPLYNANVIGGMHAVCYVIHMDLVL